MKKNLLFIIIIAFLFSCQEYKLGNKVYMEVWGGNYYRIHTSKDCSYINKDRMMLYLKFEELRNILANRDRIFYCPNCVSDENADKISGIVFKNQPIPNSSNNDTSTTDDYDNADETSDNYNLPNDDNIKQLYNELNGTYDLGSEEDFRAYLESPANRKSLYNEIKGSYNFQDEKDFEDYLGY